MRIVFGTNHFRIKSFTPKELGLADNDIEGVTIERRQKYFHLYWIPFIPTGKDWAIRKDGELFELPLEYKEALKSVDIKIGTPIWSYTLPLLVVLGFAIYGIHEKVDSYNSRRRSIARFEDNRTQLVKDINAPSIYDYYELDKVNEYTKSKFLKVFAFKGDSIQFQLPSENYDSYSVEAGELSACFSAAPEHYNLFWFKRTDLLKLVQQDYYNNDFEGSTIDMLDYNAAFQLKKIHQFRGPDFYDNGEGNIYNNHISISIKNRGVQTSITEIKNIDGTVSWQNETPFIVGANQKFSLEGTYQQLPVYNIEITCQDADTVYKYELTGKGIDRNLKKL